MSTTSTGTDQQGLRAVQDDPAAVLAAARSDLEKATAEAAEAQRLIDALEEQVREGDEAVDAEALGREYGVKRLAELRKEAAEQRARQARADVVAQRRAAVLTDAEEALTAVSMDNLAGLYNAAHDALLALAEAVLRRRRLITDTSRELAELEPRRRGMVQVHGGAEAVTVGGVQYRHQDTPAAVLLPRLLVQVSKEIIGTEPAGLPDLHAALYAYLAGSPTPLEQLAAERRAEAASA
jgi:hypothetical protein